MYGCIATVERCKYKSYWLPLTRVTPHGVRRCHEVTEVTAAVSAAASVGASALQRCPSDTRTLVRGRLILCRIFNAAITIKGFKNDC